MRKIILAILLVLATENLTYARYKNYSYQVCNWNNPTCTTFWVVNGIEQLLKRGVWFR